MSPVRNCKNILLTGRPGVGKTTLIRKVIDLLNKRAGGFYTEEIREGGQRKGFKIRTLDGEEGILASKGLKSPYRVSKYGVNLQDLEKIAVESILKALSKKEVIIIDEIGKMELYSEKFKEAVAKALNSPKKLIATITQYSCDFTDDIKNRKDVELIKIVPSNLDILAEEIIDKV